MAVIGVFDSGVGGLSVTNAVKKALPEHEVMYCEDRANIPYGNKNKAELARLVGPIIQEMASRCDVIIIACNTVSTVLIEELRQSISVPLIAVEPMIKPAAELTISKTIAVFATPTTLASARYAWLVETYAKHLTVLEPDCSTWSYMIEADQINTQLIKQAVNTVCDKGADVIVLGCTHYHWIEDLVEEIAASRAKILQSEQPVISQVRRVLSQLG